MNGKEDIMVPIINSYKLNKKIKNSKLVIYDDAGHGGIFQNYKEFTKLILEFLK
ncbi:alpha/beta fold hydrolase [Apilactobacillus xinyiensis]|uniref:alpha/beta fold hydrolase n=1 Tax=Apilactobacillus xinyiensis TaxID=2841032 RepID=UPI0020353948|nr:alpha/beta hydrolase [Apilactobacillus xinyiensis]